MATQSGTSLAGLQTLVVTSESPSALMSIAMTGTPLPPRRRVGYFVLYMYALASPNQCYIVDRDVIYAPGILRRINPNLLSAAFGFRLDSNWDVAGLLWVATVT